MTMWEIGFKSEGDYKSYDQLVQAALNDDCYQKIYPSIASEVLLENLLKFVRDINNRPTKDGTDYGTLYKKSNGRQIDSSRRYYLVKEPNLDEFNLYVKITKGRNLGYYRIYTNEDEVELLIQYGLNYVKYQASLPRIADYFKFVQDSKYFIARERCEFISRIINNNIAITKNRSKFDYDIKKLGRRMGQRQDLSRVKILSSSSIFNEKTSRSRSSSSEGSEPNSCEHLPSDISEYSSSALRKKQTNRNLTKQQQQKILKVTTKKAAPTSCLTIISSPNDTDAAATKNSTRVKQRKSNNDRLALMNQSSPIVNRLRSKHNVRVPDVSSLFPASSSHRIVTDIKSKSKYRANTKKRSHSSENEKDDESTPVSPVLDTASDGKRVNGANRGEKSKRSKK